MYILNPLASGSHLLENVGTCCKNDTVGLPLVTCEAWPQLSKSASPMIHAKSNKEPKLNIREEHAIHTPTQPTCLPPEIHPSNISSTILI